MNALRENVPGKSGSYIIQYIAAFSVYLLAVNSGMLHGWSSSAVPQLAYDINCTICLTYAETLWVVYISLGGGLIGALIASVIGNHLGRKTILIGSGLALFASWLMIAFAVNYTTLFIARYIAGIADGLIHTVIPMYVGEISAPAIRGTLGSGISTSWIFGILLINVVGSYTSITTTAFIASAIACFATACILVTPESPYYLVSINKTDKAKRSLQKLNGTPEVDDDLTRIRMAVTPDAIHGHYANLFTKNVNRRALWIAFTLRTIHQLSGTTAFTICAPLFFAEANLSFISYEKASIIYFFMQFVVNFISSAIVDKTGRRPLLFLSIVGTIIALLIEGTYFLVRDLKNIHTDSCSYGPLATLLLFVIFFNIGLQGLPVLMLGELFSVGVKPFALGMIEAYYNILTLLVSIFLVVSTKYCGLYFPFFWFAFWCVYGLVLTIIFTPETKGKTLEEIQELLEGPKGKVLDIDDHNNENVNRHTTTFQMMQ